MTDIATDTVVHVAGFHLETPAGFVYRIPADVLDGLGRGWNPTWTAREDSRAAACEAIGTPTWNQPRLVLSPIKADALVATWERRSNPTTFRLQAQYRDMTSFAERLPRAEWLALSEADDPVAQFYEAEPGETFTESQAFDVSTTELWPTNGDVPDRPELPEGAKWAPSSAWIGAFGIVTHDHIIPGALHGFRAAACREILKLNPNIDTYGIGRELTADNKGLVKYRVIYPYPLTDAQRKRRLRAKQATHTSVSVEVNVGSDAVPGTDMAEAIHEWEHRLAKVVEDTPLPAVACLHCAGTGFVKGGK